MGTNRRDPHVLDDADILAVADPSDDNTIPRARRPGFLAAKPTLAFPVEASPSPDSTTRLPPPARPARATLPPPRLPAHSAWPKPTSTASPFARRVDSQPPFRSVGPLTPVEAHRPSEAPPPPVAVSAAPPQASQRTVEVVTHAPRRGVGATIAWGVSFMGVGAAAAAGVFFLLSRVGAPLPAPAAAPTTADPPVPAAAIAPAATPTHEPAVAVGVQKRPQVVTFDDALVVDDPAAAASSVALAASAAPAASPARRFRRAAPAAKESTPADVLGAALSGSQESAPTPATAAAPPAPPPPPAPKPQSEEPRRPRTPMEALADAQLKSSLK